MQSRANNAPLLPKNGISFSGIGFVLPQVQSVGLVVESKAGMIPVARMGKRANQEGSVYKRKDGRWVASIVLENGKRKACFLPMHECLILTHILQTEVKSQVNALKKRLQREPAFPDSPPSRRTVMGACQIATQTSDLCPESAKGHSGRRFARTLS